MNKMFLIISDSFSKWPEIFKVKKADTSNTLLKSKKVFARFGLPNTILTDTIVRLSHPLKLVIFVN